MRPPQYHILVCMSFRGIEAKGACLKKHSQELLQYLDMEIADRNMDALVSSTGCLQVCDNGPIVIVYPQGDWYGGVEGEEAIDAILDALEEGRSCPQYLLT